MGNCLMKNLKILNQQNQNIDRENEGASKDSNEYLNLKKTYRKNHNVLKMEFDDCIRSHKKFDKKLNVCMNCKQIFVGFEAYKVHFFDKHVCKIRKIVR